MDQRSSISSSRQEAVEPSMTRQRSFKNDGVLIICRVLLASTEQLGEGIVETDLTLSAPSCGCIDIQHIECQHEE